MNKKKFAIFITSYNYAEYISQAIESVINQTDPDWYLYIVDNCSTDNTEEIVKKYVEKDSRISWKKHIWAVIIPCLWKHLGVQLCQ